MIFILVGGGKASAVMKLNSSNAVKFLPLHGGEQSKKKNKNKNKNKQTKKQSVLR